MSPRMRFIDGVTHSQPAISFTFEGQSYSGFAGENIVSAMMRAGVLAMRRTRMKDEARGYYCGMGLCWECAVHVEGKGVVRGCNYPLSDGLVISFADRLQKSEPDTK